MISWPVKPKMVILLLSVTFSPFKEVHCEFTSGMVGVIVGKVIKLFTPEAKKRYATIGKMNSTKRTKFFFMAN
jgi:hypothetical protein